MAIQNKTARVAENRRPVNRPPSPGTRPSGLYLVALRSRVAHTEHLVPGRKLIIPVEPALPIEPAAKPVKLTRHP